MNVDDRRNLPVVGVDEALGTVLEAARPLPPEEVDLDRALGRCLAVRIVASADMPPFDRTAMDGFAVRAADVAGAPVELEIVEEIPAGKDPSRSVGAGQASAIMTGAPIPPGADAVVMVEKTERPAPDRVRVLRSVEPGRHIRRAGEDLRRGAVLLEPGVRIGAAATALLAAEGRSRVAVHGRPSVAVLSTGDELVPISETPSGSRIRETNSWSLRALLRPMGIEPRLLGIAGDDEAEIGAKIAEGLRSDVLFVSGGVSMGERDFVGACLARAGCRALFQRVAIQPGKPLFFGLAGEGERLVFGLPGNPVSSIVDFLVFARPALRRMMGDPSPVDPCPAAILLEPVRRRPGRRGYLPAHAFLDAPGRLAARPLPSMGSADLVTLRRANSLLIAPEDRAELPAGEPVRLLMLGLPAGSPEHSGAS